jgi:hypothetical protein
MILNVEERIQFQYILPVQGNLKSLELVDSITNKLKIKDEKENEREFIFEIEEIQFLQDCIKILDQNNKLNFQSLSVIRKIMEEII